LESSISADYLFVSA